MTRPVMSSGLSEVLRMHTYVGMADETLALLQHGTRLYLLDVAALSSDMFYQQVSRMHIAAAAADADTCSCLISTHCTHYVLALMHLAQQPLCQIIESYQTWCSV